MSLTLHLGKSSVLEAITEIPFPRKENLCTRFATEVILRKSDTKSISCRIIPDKLRSIEEQNTIGNHKLEISSLDELPSLIDHVIEVIGLDDQSRGPRAFARDIFSIEFTGPDQPQLTLVDLPGLIHSENKSQTKEDIELITTLVDTYLENKRTIILPIVSARNDPANQVILSRARQFDPEGRRTLGIITKPDELPNGSESEQAFIALAKNENIHFALGWHVLKNRGFADMNHTFDQRNKAEKMFFKASRWMELPPGSLGIEALRVRLSDLLFNHIKEELPSLHVELDDLYRDTLTSLKFLGENRTTLSAQRAFLMKSSTDFRDIVKAAVNGHYEDRYFAEQATDTNNVRLCAVVQQSAIHFAEAMRKCGHKYVMDHGANPLKGKTANTLRFCGTTLLLNQVRFTQSQALDWVKTTMEKNRGRELPGNFNPVLIGELFHIQSQNWNAIAKAYVDMVIKACSNFCRRLLGQLCPRDVAGGYLGQILQQALDKRAENAYDELEKLRSDLLGPPITYNHYYTTNIQKSRKRKLKSSHKGTSPAKRQADDSSTPAGVTFGSVSNITQPLSRQTSGCRAGTPSVNVGGSYTGLTQKVGVGASAAVVVSDDEDGDSDSDIMDVVLDMDAHSCSDALDSLMAYYKVARKTFIDNVCVQVVDRHVMRGLEEVFSPLEVSRWDDETVSKASAESQRIMEERKRLESRKEKLKAGKEVFAWNLA